MRPVNDDSFALHEYGFEFDSSVGWNALLAPNLEYAPSVRTLTAEGFSSLNPLHACISRDVIGPTDLHYLQEVWKRDFKSHALQWSPIDIEGLLGNSTLFSQIPFALSLTKSPTSDSDSDSCDEDPNDVEGFEAFWRGRALSVSPVRSDFFRCIQETLSTQTAWSVPFHSDIGLNGPQAEDAKLEVNSDELVIKYTPSTHRNFVLALDACSSFTAFPNHAAWNVHWDTVVGRFESIDVTGPVPIRVVDPIHATENPRILLSRKEMAALDSTGEVTYDSSFELGRLLDVDSSKVGGSMQIRMAVGSRFHCTYAGVYSSMPGQLPLLDSAMACGKVFQNCSAMNPSSILDSAPT